MGIMDRGKSPISTESFRAEIDELKKTNAKYRKVVQAGIAKWVQDYQAGRIKIGTVDDLRKLIEVDLQLQRYDQSIGRKLARYGGDGIDEESAGDG